MNRDKQHFIDVGFVDFGYISPELTSPDEFPEYIQKEVEKSIEDIQAHQGYDTLTLGFITDIHYSDSYNHNVRTARLMNAYNTIADRVNIDMLILGGDYTNDGTKAYKTNNYRELRAFLGNDYFPVNGNHDDNSIWDAYIEAEKSTHHLHAEELYTLFYNHLPSLGAEFDKNNYGLYYMYNDYAKNVRYIFLDGSDLPEDYDKNGKLKYRKQDIFAFSQKQIDWLVNEALVFDEEGWDVIVTIHDPEAPSEGVLLKILEAYKAGGKINGSFTTKEYTITVDTDFSKITRGEVITVLAGHWHADMLKTEGCEIPRIYTNCAMMYLPDRVDGTEAEILFDVLTIDRKTRKIHITRVGLGDDRDVQY